MLAYTHTHTHTNALRTAEQMEGHSEQCKTKDDLKLAPMLSLLACVSAVSKCDLLFQRDIIYHQRHVLSPAGHFPLHVISQFNYDPCPCVISATPYLLSLVFRHLRQHSSVCTSAFLSKVNSCFFFLSGGSSIDWRH